MPDTPLFTKTKTLFRGPLLAGVMLLASLPLQGAPSQKPLFLQQRVQPNIMLLLDGSVTMQDEVVRYDTGNCRRPFSCRLNYVKELRFSDGKRWDARRLALCPGVNTLAYDPSKTYTPWAGNDQDGVPYRDYRKASIKKVRAYPFINEDGQPCHIGFNTGFSLDLYHDPSIRDPLNSGECDLTTDIGPDGHGIYYFPWVDENHNNQYDEGECKIEDKDRVWVQLRPGVEGRQMSAEQQGNFANWFSYYRRKEYVVKRALSEIISESRERVGMALLQPELERALITDEAYGDPKWLGLEIKNMDDKGYPVDRNAAQNKQRLLRNLFRIKPSTATPLRKALANVGRYFKGDSEGAKELFGFSPASASPILSAKEGGECQQNFVILLSDGYWNGDSPEVGDTDAYSSGYDGQSYADGYANTLADVAMLYYESDLSTLPNKVPAPFIFPGDSRDDNPAQHLVTYTVAFGTTGGGIPFIGSAPCYPPNREDPVKAQGWPEICSDPTYEGEGSGWPEPEKNTSSTIDDLLHAAWNGRGQFMNTANPQQLIDSLKAAISDIATRTEAIPAAAAVTINSTNMRSGGYIYQAGFDSQRWSGQLSAYKLTKDQLSDKPAWEAHKLLARRTEARVMITYNGRSGVPFRFPDDYRDPDPENDLHPDQIADLLTNAPRGDADEIEAFGKALLGYLRGDTRNEARPPYNFRPRDGQLLGDIIHSAPVYVGSPNPATYPDAIEATSYRQWATATSDDPNVFHVSQRQPMIYVGANDGGLHGFNANTGKELFVYLPKSLFSSTKEAGLHWLADPGYSHRYYVDQTPAIGDVFIEAQWKTLLVSGLGGGGKALFALDITNPGALASQEDAAKRVLWEFTHKNLGYSFGQPTLAKLNNGKWAAIFGNGYDNSPDGDGRARLFIVDLTNGALIRSIDTGVGKLENDDCNDEKSRCNGLSAPAVVDLDGDGTADRAYAGDLAGNLWVFDLASTKPKKWRKKRLFKTRSGQPITTRPAVTTHPTQKSQATAPNTMIFFGTGRYIDKKDIDSSNIQSFYGIWDNGEKVLNGRSDLVEQRISTDSNIPDNLRLMSRNPVNYSQKRGWYIDFKTQKERIIVDPILFGQLILFTTIIPDQNICGTAGGSWLMALDSGTGGEPRITALDINSDGVFNESDMTGEHNVSGLKSGNLYWQPGIIQSGSGNAGTILLPKDNESNTSVSRDTSLIDQIDIQGTVRFKARSSWSHYNFQ